MNAPGNLTPNDSPPGFKMVGTALVLFFLLVLCIYSNSFQASWQFDDKPNIINNHYLHLSDLHLQSLVKTLFTDPTHPREIGHKLYRPVACLTFALNWYFGKDNVGGYHAVNVAVHILTAFLLFSFIVNLLKTPNLEGKFSSNAHSIALLAAALWAVNPIQTQAVTYIVQRMASLAAMFYILGLLFYVKFRTSGSSLHRILLLLGCILAFLFALGSKENAATMPAALLLVEFICFQDLSLQRTRRVFIGGLIVGGLFLAVLGSWVFIADKPPALIGGYDHRPFGLSERLLTEPRIMLFYLSLIFYPITGRLSIEHDVAVSTSLFHPWTTFPAILLTLVLIGIGFSQIRRRPLIALAILFFYLNHIVESTIIPLELVFEHRNYLPSFFLFLPVSASLMKLFDYFKQRNDAGRHVLAGFMVLLIIAIGSGTYIRNRAWATEASLWQDAMVKAPKSARPLTNLAWQMAYGPQAGPGQYDAALKLYEKALSLHKSRSALDPVIMDNMAGIYFRKGQYQKAVDLLENALVLAPDYLKGRYDLSRILMAAGRWDAAAAHVDYLLSKNGDHEEYLNLKGLILLRQKRFADAVEYFTKSFFVEPRSNRPLIGLGVAYSLSGDYKQAETVLRHALQVPPQSMTALLGLIDNSIRAGNTARATEYADSLVRHYNAAVIKDQLKHLADNSFLPPLSVEPISGIIETRLAQNSEEKPEIQN
jgi:tetratricopeptide (TPR) repeat protein